jgi:flagellar basal body-associated protein FliL
MSFFRNSPINILFLLVLAGCAPKNEAADDVRRSQREREIFMKPSVTQEELNDLHRMPDDLENNIYFRDLDMIRGVTRGENRELFVVQFIIGYDFSNRRLGLELINRKLVIEDRVRALLGSLSSADFAGDRVEELRQAITREVNKVLVSGQANEVLILRLETYPVP